MLGCGGESRRRAGSRGGQQPRPGEKGPHPGKAGARGGLCCPQCGHLRHRPPPLPPLPAHQARPDSSGSATGGGEVEGRGHSRSQHVHARGLRAHPPPPLSPWHRGPRRIPRCQLPAPDPAPGRPMFHGGRAPARARSAPHSMPTREQAKVGGGQDVLPPCERPGCPGWTRSPVRPVLGPEHHARSPRVTGHSASKASALVPEPASSGPWGAEAPRARAWAWAAGDGVRAGAGPWVRPSTLSPSCDRRGARPLPG